MTSILLKGSANNIQIWSTLAGYEELAEDFSQWEKGWKNSSENLLQSFLAEVPVAVSCELWSTSRVEHFQNNWEHLIFLLIKAFSVSLSFCLVYLLKFIRYFIKQQI